MKDALSKVPAPRHPHAGRAAPGEVDRMAGLCLEDPLVQALLEAMDSYAVVLNPQRQILAANPALLEALSREAAAPCQGLRPGEALGCVMVPQGPDGCGTSPACPRCGAFLAILAAQQGEISTRECLLSTERNGRWESREFQVRAVPLHVGGHALTLLALKDISALKRRETLERIFIHDLKNSLQGLQGWTELLQAAGADAGQLAGRILAMAEQLTAEVESQHHLLQAEQGELEPDLRPVAASAILDGLLRGLEDPAARRLLRLTRPGEACRVRTDPVILGRILENMVRNALEALPPGGLAQVWCELRGDRPTFVVQNPGCRAPEVAERVFQRSFTTKGRRGRGLGTYGMKVLGESVLGGRVGFTTSWEEGTRFFIELPGGE